MIRVKGKYNEAIVYHPNPDYLVIDQLKQYLNTIVSKDQKIRIMPDCHAGKGVIVGFTATLNDYVVPNIVGVDIGCGVYSVNIGKEIPPLDEIDQFVKENIPLGKEVHSCTKHLKDVPYDILEQIRAVANKTQQNEDYVLCSLGSLGGGNHFIEVGEDSQGNYWLTVHSGSRNFGLKVANYHQNIAKNHMKKYLLKEKIEELKQEYSGKELGQKIEEFKQSIKVPNELAFITGDRAKQYFQHMQIAQIYATWNRKLIIDLICDAFNLPKIQEIESVHNYIDFSDNVIRKGAIRAHKDEWVVIPMHMTFGIVIGKGKGNAEWNNSAPHGAGRKLSRKEAKEKLTVDDLKQKLEDAGVYSTTYVNAVDEAPDAYKDPNEILSLLHETVDIVDVIRPILNIKG